MKNRRDTGVFLRIYHRSGLKSRLDSYSRSIFSIPFQLAAEIGFSFPGSRTIPRGWNLVKISTNSNRSIDENFIFFYFSLTKKSSLEISLKVFEECINVLHK